MIATEAMEAAETIVHRTYFEVTSDGERWPACGCGEAQLMSDSRDANSWIADHRPWKELTK